MTAGLETTEPRISVVMPVYNGEQFLRAAIESILNQSYKNFEFIIVDDGSVDSTATIIQNYQADDPRITAVHLPTNSGLISALNLGLNQAKGEYIARADADDIYFPQRFERQLEVFEQNPNLALLGSSAYTIDADGQVKGEISVPSRSGLIKWRMIFGNPFIHSSMMMRKSVIAKYNFYTPGCDHAEDYDLWSRVCLREVVDNLQEPLMQYRIWGNSISLTKQSEQAQLSNYISQRQVIHYLGKPVPDNIALGLRYTKFDKQGKAPENVQEIREIENLLLELYAAFIKITDLSEAERRAVATDLAMRYHQLAYTSSKISLSNAIRLSILGFYRSPASLQRLLRIFRKKYL